MLAVITCAKVTFTFTDWPLCGIYNSCAIACINTYVAKYRDICAYHVNKPIHLLTCQDHARIHFGGPKGCRGSTAKLYADAVASLCELD